MTGADMGPSVNRATSPVIGTVRDFSPPSVQIVKLRKPCELDGRIDRLFEIDAFRIG